MVSREGKTVTILEYLCLVVYAEPWSYQYGLFVAEASRLMLGQKQQYLSISQELAGHSSKGRYRHVKDAEMPADCQGTPILNFIPRVFEFPEHGWT